MNHHDSRQSVSQGLFSKAYYTIKPMIPRSLQITLRRSAVRKKLSHVKDLWPIDQFASKKPANWQGWPDGKDFALLLTHDVETSRGLERCRALAEVEMELGFRSSFNFVAKRYNVPEELRHYLVTNGFEVGLHGLHHDGKKFNSINTFKKRAREINYFLKEWDAVGFRAPSMHCRLDWIGELDILYDMSTFDTDPFEPLSKGVRTIFPFMVQNYKSTSNFVELPYTLPQDFTLFVLMQEKNIGIWKQKLDWIYEHSGMVLLNTHPDYMSFNKSEQTIEEYPISYYRDFLVHILNTYKDKFWHALPKEVSSFARNHYKERDLNLK